MQDLLIQLAVGAIGGNGAGAVLKNFNLGPIGNTVAGLVGGGVGGQLVSSLLGSGAADGMLGQLGGAGAGGAVVMVLVGLVKNMLAKKS